MNAAREQHGYVEARIKLRSTAEGGRQFPIQSGYMPNWWIPGPSERDGRTLTSGGLSVIGAEQVVPGGEALVRIYPFAPQLWQHVEVGTAIEMTEGPSFVVAEGTVTGVCF